MTTHIYDRETGKVYPWIDHCPIAAAPYEIVRDGASTILRVTPYHQWNYNYPIDYDGFAMAHPNNVPYIYVDRILTVTIDMGLFGWTVANLLPPFQRVILTDREREHSSAV